MVTWPELSTQSNAFCTSTSPILTARPLSVWSNEAFLPRLLWACAFWETSSTLWIRVSPSSNACSSRLRKELLINNKLNQHVVLPPQTEPRLHWILTDGFLPFWIATPIVDFYSVISTLTNTIIVIITTPTMSLVKTSLKQWAASKRDTLGTSSENIQDIIHRRIRKESAHFERSCEQAPSGTPLGPALKILPGHYFPLYQERVRTLRAILWERFLFRDRESRN